MQFTPLAHSEGKIPALLRGHQIPEFNLHGCASGHLS